MTVKQLFSKNWGKKVYDKTLKNSIDGVFHQEAVFQQLIKSATITKFGNDHDFSKIKSYDDFKKHVPIADYEKLVPYIEEIKLGKKDILWPGKPKYLAKTSGTTSGAKYIPISYKSIKNQINGARNALLCYIGETGKTDFVDRKMIFVQGNPTLDSLNGVKTGRLSGIVAHLVPSYLQKNRLPSFETNCIDDWETKVDAIVKETSKEDLSLIGGIPSWIQMYFERLIKTNDVKTVKDIFPNFSVYVWGGVNYAPYKSYMQKLIGKDIDLIETYPASEGFIAYQNSQKSDDLLLIIDDGIFYEFIPTEEYFNENPTRLSLKDVKLGVNYALILNTNAGLWGYSIGDTVKFTSLKPYKIKVTGRIKHYTSAFGEHVIAEEVEGAIKTALQKFEGEIAEFTVAPQIESIHGKLPYHEWFIEFMKKPNDFDGFKMYLDELMQEANVYYKDLITGKILQNLVIAEVKSGGFNAFMKSRGKLGGQNKIPRLANDRQYADQLQEFITK